MAQKSESRDLEKVMLRLPDGMRDRLHAAARSNHRSANTEMVAALEQWLDNAGETTQLDRIETAVHRLEAAARQIATAADEAPSHAYPMGWEE